MLFRSTKGAKDGRPFYESLGRTPKKMFDLHPVDLLVVDSVSRKDYETSRANPKGLGVWLDRIEQAEPNNKPKVVLESWDAEELFDDKNGPTSQKHNKLWERAGYDSRVKRWNAERLNGAMRQERVMVFRIQQDLELELGDWTPHSTQSSRPMSNLLRFRDIPKQAYVGPHVDNSQSTIANARTDPMPQRVGDLVRTDRGVRRLLADEYARGTGVPKGWIDDPKKVKVITANGTTCINIWEAASESLAKSISKHFDLGEGEADWDKDITYKVPTPKSHGTLHEKAPSQHLALANDYWHSRGLDPRYERLGAATGGPDGNTSPGNREGSARGTGAKEGDSGGTSRRNGPTHGATHGPDDPTRPPLGNPPDNARRKNFSEGPDPGATDGLTPQQQGSAHGSQQGPDDPTSPPIGKPPNIN